MEIPNQDIFGEDIRTLIDNPHLQLRGDNYFREAIRYFQAPYGDIHQETIESGELHRIQAKITFAILKSFSGQQITQVVREVLDLWLQKQSQLQPIFISNLFTQIRPLMIRIIFKLLFDQHIDDCQLGVYSAAVANLHDTLKGNALRSLSTRMKMYEAITQQLQSTPLDRFLGTKDLENIDSENYSKHISCVFFHTGVVQTTEFICHTLVSIYEHPQVHLLILQSLEGFEQLPDFEAMEKIDYLNYVLNESLRLYPLLGRTNRQVQETFKYKDITFAKDSVVYLNFYRNHKLNWDDPELFKVDRWDDESEQATAKKIRRENFIPFGVGKRSCPAESFARTTTKAVIIGILKYIDLQIPQNFIHTRRLPQGVPVVINLNKYREIKLHDVEEESKNTNNNNNHGDQLLNVLENQLGTIDESESVELNVSNMLKKIIADIKNDRFSFSVFYPLLRDID